jgi:cyclopropane fatty-acyl-phospholipid synthase-like methyltransferase
VLDWLREGGAQRVLDVGCGPGQFAQFLLDSSAVDYHGIDFSSTAIAMAQRANPDHADRFHVGDVRSHSLLAQPFDHVVVLEVLEHVQADRELLSRLAPGTTVVFSVPSFDSESHVRHFDSIEAVADRYGDLVEVVDTDEIAFAGYTSRLFLVRGIRTGTSLAAQDAQVAHAHA